MIASSPSESPRRIWARRARVYLLLLGLLLFSGCISVEFGSTFRENGTATHTIVISFPRENLERREFTQVLSNLNQILQEAEDAGLAVERTERENETVIQVTNEVEDSEDTGAALNSLINAAGINAEPGINAPFKGTFRQEVEPVGGAVYILDMVIDGNELFESIASLAPTTGEAIPRETLRESVTIEYIATMPGEVFETTGEQISDETVRWELALEGQEQIYAKSRVRESQSAFLFVVTGVGVALAILVITIVIEVILIRRRQWSSRLGAAAGEFSQYTIAIRGGHWLTRNIERFFQRSDRDKDPPERFDTGEEGNYRGTHTEGD